MVTADANVDEHGSFLEARAKPADHVRCNGRKVGIAARDQVRTRLAHDIFESSRDEESACKAESEAQPSHVPLPKAAVPDIRLCGMLAWCDGIGCWKQEGEDGNDDGGNKERDDADDGDGNGI